MRTALIHLALVSLAFAHLACSASEPKTSTGAVTAKTTSALVAAATPAGTLTAGGTYWLVFDESSVAGAVKAGCAQAEKTEAAVQSCIDGVRQEGGKEAIRFASDSAGALTWTSFGVGSGQEEIFVEVPIAIESTTGTLVHTSATGPAHGAQVHGAEKGPTAITFDVLDARTIAMVDPAKGRLVFRARE